MSQRDGSSRKEKKAQRDAERHVKNKKRKFAEDDAPEEPSPAESSIPQSRNSESRSVKSQHGNIAAQVGDGDVQEKPKRRKVDSNGADDQRDNTQRDSTSKSRFILFIGNLPYSTTDNSLQTHFQKLAPFNLRHRTDPKTKKSKGFAFLEFENYDRMKTCLKLYHHSIFDPESKENGGSGKGNGKGGRRINVELTAGGGGKTENRKEKIKAKNERLEEQRKRRAEAERKEKARKEVKEGGSGARSEQDVMPAQDAEVDGIHPSRRARVKT